MKFSFAQIDQGLFLVEKEYHAKKSTHGSDVTGPYWMLIEVEITEGKIWWTVDGNEVHPEDRRLFIFLPSFCWTIEHYSKNTQVRVQGLISKVPLNFSSFSEPTLFYSNQSLPREIRKLPAFFESIHMAKSIGVCSNPSSLSLRAKRMIDKMYYGPTEIQDIATKLKTSSAVLSRSFKSDYGKPPAFYRKGLRITVGMYELMMGTPPIKAAQLAGYSDLSRFYKQFKSYLKQTPAEYLLKSKNAKTPR